MFILGIGGTVRPSSSSERVLREVLAVAREHGAQTQAFGGERMRELPMYDPASTHRVPAARELVEALRRADAVIISSSAYHGVPSGMLKNTLDYIEDLAHDDRPYLSGLPVGLISLGLGWQGSVQNLSVLRTVVHSLRGWPTPYGCTLNTAEQDRDHSAALAMLAQEVVSAAGARRDLQQV